MNYYLRVNFCYECDRFDEIHIGKSSSGWTFTFRGYRVEQDSPEEIPETIESYKEWLEVLEEYKDDDENMGIFDEDGDRVSLEKFKAIVEGTRNAPHHHAREFPADNQWTDVEGHSFSDHEFC